MKKEEALQLIEVFTYANSHSTKMLSNKGTIKKMKKGQTLFRDKEDVSSIYAVVKGLVSLYKINSHGEKKIIFVLGQGKLINEVILQDLPASVSCEVFEEATIFLIPKRDLLAVMEQDFGLTKAIIDSLSTKVRRLYRQLKNTSNTVKGDKRVAAKLWKLSEDFGIPCDAGTYINMELTITYLADMLGSTRETISRQLKVLQELDLVIIQKNKFILPQPAELVKYFKAP